MAGAADPEEVMVPLEDFWAALPFEPDVFQVEAAKAIAEGQSVVVTAPTGSGKTLVAEAAIYLALAGGRRAFYTTPIKALSNQKYADLVAAHGSEKVGLLTGDNVINGDAEIVVMTTEVLRNMIYAGSQSLERVGVAILDEVHYLQDRARGAVWEEIIIHCKPEVQLVCLSATVSNNHEFAAWVSERRGSTRLITTEHRPVPLESLYMIKDSMGGRTLHLLPAFGKKTGRKPNPRIEHMLGLERGRRRRFKTPNRIETIERLAEAKLLPAIYFIFSRAGCDAAANRLAEAGVRLTDSAARSSIRKVAEARTAHLSDSDLEVLGYCRWLTALEMGIGAHHAGLVPAFKEVVEELFESGMIKVVFATETLALGINMPARTVVLESLSKFDGEDHHLLRPGDYTQLTGRAGRRGIDIEGFGIVLHSPFVKFENVTDIASAGAHPLKSSFRPSYNMTANLVANYDRERAETLLEASFAAFQRESDRYEADAAIDATEHELAKEESAATCEIGSTSEYLALVQSSESFSGNGRIGSSLSPGQVFDVEGGARDGRYLVLKRLSRKDGGVGYLVLSTSGRVSKMRAGESVQEIVVSGEVRLPKPIKPGDRGFLNEAKRRLRKLPSKSDTQQSTLETTVEHPVAGCPDAAKHLAAARKAERIHRRLSGLVSARRASGHGLLDEFGDIRRLLEELDYLSGWELTPRGRRLRSIFAVSDLLVAESIELGILGALAPNELAAIASVFVYESRTESVSEAEWPNATLDERWNDLEALWNDLFERERRHKLVPTRRPDPGFGRLAYDWASGVTFDNLAIERLAPGDFVRVSRQLTDLLRQLRDVAPSLRDNAVAALSAVDRGVVAAQGVG